jgi:hypothetical protein
VTRAGEKVLARCLWTLYGILAVAGLALLAQALFLSARAQPFVLRAPSDPGHGLPVLTLSQDGLADRRFTQKVAGTAVAGPVRVQPVALDQVIKLTGILDFGGKQPTLAVIEAIGESKAYKAGDKVGETGVLVRDIKNYVVVEFEKRRFKVTFAGIQELPANSVGKD